MSIHETSKVEEKDNGVVVNEIRFCARCGGDHQNVFFSRFKKPMIIGRKKYWYWGMCPTLKEPIIMRREEDDKRGKSK